jgi:hypothetical protein
MGEASLIPSQSRWRARLLPDRLRGTIGPLPARVWWGRAGASPDQVDDTWPSPRRACCS